MPKPTNTLVTEHRLIEQVLNCLERMAEEGARRDQLDAQAAADAIAFFRTFVHGWHFPREEAYLTQAMNPLTAGEAEDLQFHDHQRCRTHLGEMERAAEASRAGAPGAARRFAEHAHAYIAVLMKHNEDEEDRVFPMLDRALTEEKSAEAALALERGRAPRVEQRQLDACIDAANRLADHFNVPRVGETCSVATPEPRPESADP